MKSLLYGLVAAATVSVAGTAAADTLSLISGSFNSSKQFQAEGRHMQSNVATWTMGVGTNTQSAGSFAQTNGSGNPSNFVWANDVATNFSLAYDAATDTATFVLDNGNNSRTLSYVVGDAFVNGFEIFLAARNNNAGGTSTGTLSNLMFTDNAGDTHALSGTPFMVSDGTTTIGYAGSENLSDGDWTLTGTVLFEWTGLDPKNSHTEINIKAASIEVVPLPAPVAMAGLGLIGALVVRRRIRR